MKKNNLTNFNRKNCNKKNIYNIKIAIKNMKWLEFVNICLLVFQMMKIKTQIYYN